MTRRRFAHPHLPFLDPVESARRRDDAVARVDANAPTGWKRDADAAVRDLARTVDEFTTDDVWLWMHDRGLPAPPEPRALGAVMLAAARAGLIEATDRYRKSARPVCHANPKRVWRSRVVRVA